MNLKLYSKAGKIALIKTLFGIENAQISSRKVVLRYFIVMTPSNPTKPYTIFGISANFGRKISFKMTDARID
jgi:hypothetical protein